MFGPYTVAALTASSAVTVPANAGLQTYTAFSINGATYGTTGNIVNGDTISIRFDLASYITGFATAPLAYNLNLQPKFKVGATQVTLSVLTCGDPTTPPPTGNSNCN